jgi:hypothetical protein
MLGWLGGSAAAIYAFYYTQVGLGPKIQTSPLETRYPVEGSVKTLRVTFALRNRRKHPIFVREARIIISPAVRLRAARNLAEAETDPIGFTIHANGELKASWTGCPRWHENSSRSRST